MFRHSPLIPALIPALLLGGCMGTQNRGVESIHQPVVARQHYALDLQTAGDELARGESARLNDWLVTLNLRYGDKVAIDDPASYRGARRDVSRVVGGYGLLLDDGRPITAAPVAPGTVRVVVSRMEASVPGCPDWSRNASHEFDNHTSSNYGCATNASLAAMIANPEDLVHGQSGGPVTDAARARKAIDALQKTAPSGGGGTSGGVGGSTGGIGGGGSGAAASGGGTK